MLHHVGIMLRRSLLLAGPALAHAAPWKLTQQPGLTTITLAGQPITALHSGPQWDKPFLYPLLAPNGVELSRGWPVNPRPGDNQDHAWHRGLWWGHGLINGEDFWREIKGASGFIRTQKVTARRTSAAVHFHAQHSLVKRDQSPLAALATAWTIHQTSTTRTIDFALTLQSPQPLTFGDTDDGGFAFRLREEFRQDRGARITNAEGLTGAKAVWGQPSPWTHYQATIADQPYGVALLSHPTNLRHPAGWHARNYGLNSANPFAASSFANEKGGQRGAYTLPPQAPLRLRYRVILHSGPLDVAAHYREFESQSH
jgi:hypothetical protein